ncbi:MAG: flagellar biosynthesis protein FliQ [Lysinibacillus sp.]
MTQEMVVSVAEGAIYMVLVASVPLLAVALIVGLLVSVFQATTSIQEQTLAFVPKIIAVFIALIFFAPFILSQLSSYFTDILDNLVRYIG